MDVEPPGVDDGPPPENLPGFAESWGLVQEFQRALIAAGARVPL